MIRKKKVNKDTWNVSGSQRQGSEYKTGDGSGKCENYDRKL